MYSHLKKNAARMIVTDLDGTLLDNNGSISEYSKTILNKCIEKNIITVFATARPIRVTTVFFPFIKPHAIICHNGAKILADEKIIYQCGISATVYNVILENLTRQFPGSNLAVEINDAIYANFDPGIYWEGIKYKNIDERPEGSADKILIGINDLKIGIAETGVSRNGGSRTDGSCMTEEIEKHIPEGYYLEKSHDNKIGLIINREATKWNAVKKISSHYKIGIENIVCFGDNENDLEMVRNCGTGIAVENGIEEIKKTARYVCGSNEENGVAKWIESHILEKQ